MASIIVIAAVLVLDVLAFVLAIGAERRRSYVRDGSSSQLHQSVCFDRSTHLPARPVLQVNYVSVDPAGGSYCVYSSDASTAYGVSALLLLLAAQAVAMVATRCFCCGRALSPGRWRAWSGICFIVCW
jgi:hypothetical protein